MRTHLASTDDDDAPDSIEDDFEPEPSRFAGEDWSLRAWLGLLRDLYCTFDRRTLGASRIAIGFLLLTDLVRRAASWGDMYSDEGVLPATLNLGSPHVRGVFSIFNGFDTRGELRVLWVFMVVNAACLLVGYRTRVAQVVALVFHVGMNSRVPLIENGGYVVNNLLLLWTAFLPLGDRFSVDALIASMKRRRETTAADLNDRSDTSGPGLPATAPYASFAGFALIAQIAAIYYFNAVHKTGPSWREGTAVHTVLYLSRMATPITGLLRDRIPASLSTFMTHATMVLEAGIPVLLLQPLARTWSRRLVVVMMCTLHLAFGATFVLGPFSWSCCAFATLLFSRDDWEVAASTMRRAHRARTVVFDPRSGGALLCCRVLKRLDRFELLTFVAEEGVPLGVGVAGVAGARGGRPARPCSPTWSRRCRSGRRWRGSCGCRACAGSARPRSRPSRGATSRASSGCGWGLGASRPRPPPRRRRTSRWPRSPSRSSSSRAPWPSRSASAARCSASCSCSGPPRSAQQARPGSSIR